MKIAVCVKAVPDAAAGRRIDPATKRLDRSGDLVISDFDTYAVEEGLKLKESSGEGEVVVVSMGPEKAMDALRKALAMGADRSVFDHRSCPGKRRRAGDSRCARGCAREGRRGSRALRAAVGGRRRCLPLGGGGREAALSRHFPGVGADRRRRRAHRQTPDGVRLRHDPRTAPGDRRGVGRDQHAAVPVAEGDHGREEEAAGDARRRAGRRGGRPGDDRRRAATRRRRAARRRSSRTTATPPTASSSSSSRRGSSDGEDASCSSSTTTAPCRRARSGCLRRRPRSAASSPA